MSLLCSLAPANRSPIPRRIHKTPNRTAVSLFGCIQCGIRTYHDNNTNTCKSCLDVSSRAYTAKDGATNCMYCPYSSDLHLNREQCQPFACSMYCWLTIIVAMVFPLLLMGSKCLLTLVMRSHKKSSKETLEEQDDMDDWVVEQLIRQVQTTQSMKQLSDRTAAAGAVGEGVDGFVVFENESAL